MAYVSKELKKRLVALAKPILKEYGVKATFRVEHYTALVCTIKSAPWDLLSVFRSEEEFRGYTQLRKSSLDSFEDDPKSFEFLTKLFAALNSENFDHSDIMTDYFHVGYYLTVAVGTWEKHFVVEN